MPSDDDGLAPTEGPGFQEYAGMLLADQSALLKKRDPNSVYIMVQYTHAKYMTYMTWIDFVCAQWLLNYLAPMRRLPFPSDSDNSHTSLELHKFCQVLTGKMVLAILFATLRTNGIWISDKLADENA